jgi:hypothetical protein
MKIVDRVMSSIISNFLIFRYGSEDPFRWSIMELHICVECFNHICNVGYFVIKILYGTLPSMKIVDRVMSSIISNFLIFRYGSEDPFRWSIMELPLVDDRFIYFSYIFNLFGGI